MPIGRDVPRLANHEVMAAREYIVAGHQPRSILVRIGFPKRRATDGRYECVAEIDEGHLVSSKPMNGVDAVEALELAILMIGTELQCIQEHAEGPLTWLDGKRRDLGFPTYPDYSLMAAMGPESEADT